mmetsp:Transcript_25894/g.59153  ORF Transcript_25894/g.59153 Transcript_25894/m.59153 type:complete len:356 (+) Transcript_25894:92-1159(+)
MNHQCPESPESESSSDDNSFPSPSAPPPTTTIFRRRRLSNPLPESPQPRCRYKRRSSSLKRASSSARSLSSCAEASGDGIAVTCSAPRELQEMLEMGTDSSGANSDTSSDGGNGPVHVLAAGSTTKPSGTQPRRPLRRSSFCKDSRSTPMTKSRRRRVTFNDGVIPKLNAVKEANHPGEGQRDEVAELRLELCNQKRLIADLLARMESLEQRNSASVPEDVNDVSEPSHTACDEHRQIDELKLELAKEWGRNAALSSRVDSLSDVEARNRILEEENEELRRAVAEIQDKMSSFRCNVAKTLTQSGKSSGTEETVQGILSSDSDSGSVCSGTFTQSAGEASCFGERGAREEAEDCL